MEAAIAVFQTHYRSPVSITMGKKLIDEELVQKSPNNSYVLHPELLSQMANIIKPHVILYFRDEEHAGLREWFSSANVHVQVIAQVFWPNETRHQVFLGETLEDMVQGMRVCLKTKINFLFDFKTLCR